MNCQAVCRSDVDERLTGKDNKAEGESLKVLGWVSPIASWLGGGSLRRRRRREHSNPRSSYARRRNTWEIRRPEIFQRRPKTVILLLPNKLTELMISYIRYMKSSGRRVLNIRRFVVPRM